LRDSETTAEVVPGSTLTAQGLKRGEINCNDTPWAEDIFDDDKDMKEVRRAILTLNKAYMVRN
jgi:hypothetical protein